MSQEPGEILEKNLINDIVRQTARDRDLDSEQVFGLIEEALARILHRNNGREGNFVVKIDREDLSMQSQRVWEVIDDDEPIEHVDVQKTLEAARDIDKEAAIGGEVSVPWDSPRLDNHANAQIFKQKFISCLRKAERSKLLSDLLERGDRLLSGTVKNIDKSNGDFIIEVQRVECRLRREDAIPKENLRRGDRVRCLILEIIDDLNRGKIIYLTRASEDFLKELFRREVPEIEKGILEIVSVARDPGYRSKIAVRSKDTRVDPVGTCVGMRGSRVQSVTADLSGEKVDIIPWSEDEMSFVLQSLAPAEIETVRVTGAKSCDVIVAEDNLAKAIGRSGMNVKLAARLTGWQINIIDREEADQRENERVDRKQSYFRRYLDIDENVARILYEEGFNTIEDLADAEHAELLEIEGFSEEAVVQIMAQAQEALARIEKDLGEKTAKASSEFMDLIENKDLLRILLLNDIVDIQALADMSTDELQEATESEIGEADAVDLIMQARGHVSPAE